MSIYGIFGGIGAGKTLLGVYLCIEDLKSGKKVFSNTRFKGLDSYASQIHYLTRLDIEKMFEQVKDGKINLMNSTIFIQEAHNYIDSRASQSVKNRVFSYWILQSRHTGQGSCDIVYDDQGIGQVDIRLRRNTDYILLPEITRWDIEGQGKKKVKKPLIITFSGSVLKGQTNVKFKKSVDVSFARECYDTHELVDF
jgi:hypothetical protein